jgi:hypothetical protein
MIERTHDADRINFLINHPEIRPFVGGDVTKPIDLSEAVANPANVFLGGEHGAFCCSWAGPGDYEVHTLILPSGRGKWAYEFARAGRQHMVELQAKHLWTCVHPDAANVRFFTLRAGFRPAGTITRDLGAGPVTYDIFDWRA